jgi:hypothetical protein
MHRVDVVGFDGSLGGRKRGEHNACDNKGEFGTFHGILLFVQQPPDRKAEIRAAG